MKLKGITDKDKLKDCSVALRKIAAIQKARKS